MFDPDYRLRGWRDSQYAPRNRKRGRTITKAARSKAVNRFWLYFVLSLPFTYTLLDRFSYNVVIASQSTISLSDAKLWIGAFCFMMAFAIFLGVMVPIYAKRLKEEEWERIRPDDELDIEQAPQQSYAPYAAVQRPSENTLFNFDAPKRNDGRQFEVEIAEMITLATGHPTEICGGAGDGGIDVKVFSKEDGRRLVGIVQCKHYAPDRTVPPGAIRELATVKRQAGVKVAYLATTARFSTDARIEADKLGIRLIDGNDIARARGQRSQSAPQQHAPTPAPQAYQPRLLQSAQRQTNLPMPPQGTRPPELPMPLPKPYDPNERFKPPARR